MAIAMRMPQFGDSVPNTLSGNEQTRVGRYQQHRTYSPPRPQLLIRYEDLLDAQRLGQMVGELFWSAFTRATSIPRLDKAATLSALDQLKTLTPNWSGYNSSPINRRVIQAAKEFIWELPNDAIGTPKVVPMTRGRLQFEWHRRNRSLELEFADSDQIHYLKWDSDADIEEEDVISVNDVAMIHALLRWFEAEPGNG
jgi:hypothetical protein